MVLIPATVAAVVVIRIVCKTDPLRLWLEKEKLQLPGVGRLWKTIYTARFARTLSSLYTSGIPIVTAIQIARGTVGNVWIEQQFDNVIPVLRGGTSLSESMELISGFIPQLAFNIKIGEETGSLDNMLQSVADELEYEAEEAISKMTTLLEPVLIIVMALIVGFIMIAVMMPIYESYSAIGLDI
ncbi:MAG: type II secretion system F family protein [Lachnospiraceae bacterium]